MNHMILPSGLYAVGKFVPENSVLVPPKPNGPHTWDGSKWVFDGYTREEAMNRLRSERDRLLAETDWWALSDRNITDEQKDYRQKLRDITKNYTSLEDVVWPEKPE